MKYEKGVNGIQHKCISTCMNWVCSELDCKLNVLLLETCYGDKEKERELVVSFCPFCGYSSVKADDKQ